jgi:hypothetical protein
MQTKTARRSPHRFSEPELKKAGVRILEQHTTVLLECTSCGARWSPNLQTGSRLPAGYWKCPEGCNR